MSNLKLRLFLVFTSLSFAFSPSFASQFGAQHISENTYRNTLGPVVLFEPVALVHGKWDWALGSFFSDKDWESLLYRTQFEVAPFSWAQLGLRGSHRAQLSETFSHTTFLGYLTLLSPPLGPFGLSLTGGWYRRFTFLKRASVLPFLTRSDFSQHDFAVDFQIKTQWSARAHTLVRVSTVDELDVYNLNHPFVETSFSVQEDSRQRAWKAYFRYHISLGFGRLDRFTFGLAYQVSQPFI